MADYENNLNNTETTSGGAPQPNTNAQVQPASEPKPEQINEPAQGAQSAPSYAEPQGQSYTTPPQEGTYYAPQANQAPQGNYNQPGYQAPPQQAYYAPQNGAQVPPYGMPQQPVEQKASVGLAILSFFIPIAGLIIFLTKKNDRPKTAKVSGICALVSFILNIVIGVIGGVIGGVAATKIAENPDQLDSYISDAIGDNSDNLVQGDELGNFVCDVTDVSKKQQMQTANRQYLLHIISKTIRIQQLIFDSALYTIVKQNDNTLIRTVLGTSDDTDLADTTATEPGATSKVKRAYTLNDQTSDVVFELYDNTDENNMYYLEYTFTLGN
ncbi:MAG: DUF5067 domain-containing protein [Anaerotruncus sp.]|nr:MAG: DUF5067 domain-containing protein [Anaerotruncus sp.]